MNEKNGMNQNLFMNAERVAELWAAVKAELAKCSTPEQVDQAISNAMTQVTGIQYKAVDTLPETGEANTIYLVPTEEDSNVRDQYLWQDEAWVNLGSMAADLSGCWSKEDLRVMTAEELAAILV